MFINFLFIINRLFSCKLPRTTSLKLNQSWHQFQPPLIFANFLIRFNPGRKENFPRFCTCFYVYVISPEPMKAVRAAAQVTESQFPSSVSPGVITKLLLTLMYKKREGETLQRRRLMNRQLFHRCVVFSLLFRRNVCFFYHQKLPEMTKKFCTCELRNNVMAFYLLRFNRLCIVHKPFFFDSFIINIFIDWIIVSIFHWIIRLNNGKNGEINYFKPTRLENTKKEKKACEVSGKRNCLGFISNHTQGEGKSFISIVATIKGAKGS